MGGPHVRFEKPRRRPKAAVVAGVEPRRVREIGVYQEYQRVLPRRWVVVVVVGEHHVDGGPCSGGRRLGWSWISSGRAAKAKLTLGLAYWVIEEAIGEIWAPGTASPERIEVEAEAERGGRSRGRRAPRGSPSGWAGSSEVVESCGGESGLGGAIYSRPESVAVNG